MVWPNKTFPDSHIIETETPQLPRGASCLPIEAVKWKVWDTVAEQKATYFPSIIPFLDQNNVNLIALSKEKGSNIMEAPHGEDGKCRAG